MPAFFVPSLAECGKLLLFVPPPGPLRGGGVSLRSEKLTLINYESVRVICFMICAIFAPNLEIPFVGPPLSVGTPKWRTASLLTNLTNLFQSLPNI